LVDGSRIWYMEKHFEEKQLSAFAPPELS